MGIQASSSEAPSAGHYQTGGCTKGALVRAGPPSISRVAALLISPAAVLLLIWRGGGDDKTLSSLSFGQLVVHLVSAGSGGCLLEGECSFLVPSSV